MRALLFISLILSFSFSAAPLRAETVEEYLRAFHADPATMMERLPSRVDSNGVATPRGFINERKVDKRFRERKAIREKIMGHRPEGAIIGADDPNSQDLPEQIIEPGSAVVRNLNEMDARHLTRSTVPVIPWSDSYWPTYKGQTAYRYADPSVPRSKVWLDYRQYAMSNPASSVIASGDASRIDTLSPAEKYDFAVGDNSFSLTQFAWNTGQKLYDEAGGVPTWMGICHGWSGATHMGAIIPPAPVHIIAANGTPITFYPQDVKALQSMLWANASVATRFVGNRCDTSHPPKNNYGRIMDPKCFDTNPGTWHIALINQLGVNQRSFVMDSTYDAEVWNFSVAGYKYHYFNPQSFQESDAIARSAIPIERYTLDKFHEFRAPGTRYIVGVTMDATYVGAINPTRTPNVEPLLKTSRFIYDLELDAGYNIIGGEWYSNAHPDFIWTFDKSAQAKATGDAQIASDAWNTGSPVPADWAGLAQHSSSRGTPLFSFISKIASMPALELENARPVAAEAVTAPRR